MTSHLARVGKLDRKTIIITGASGGIGAATAALFSHEGACLVLTGRNDERLRQAAAACDPERTRCIVADAIDPDSPARVVGFAREMFGNLHGLFVNAGIEGPVVPLVSLSLHDFDVVWATNVRSTIALMQHAIPLIITSGGGSIVVTCSTSSFVGAERLIAYATSKAALLGVVRTAALELGKSGVRVNAIAPGGIANRMMYALAEQATPGPAEAAIEQFTATLPLGRLGTNEEIAKLALFLASDDSSYCTGSTFVADGGLLAR
jgi:NAD(P)-dependent dehydrogenase (short-subunit alcohol dehydrogenase family)